MRSIIRGVVGIALITCSAAACVRDGLEPIEAEMAKLFGKRLADEADKIQMPQVKIVADADKSNGVHLPEKLGTLIVPQKDLIESEELAAKFKEPKGAPLAYLFLYHLTPVINGAAVDGSRLRGVTLMGDEGQQHTVHVLLLAVRQLSDDDYRLYGYGHEDKPLVDARFSEAAGPGPEPVAVEVKDVSEQSQQGRLVVTVFGKYQASFPVGYRPE